MTRVCPQKAPGRGSGQKGDSAEVGKGSARDSLPGRGRISYGLSPLFGGGALSMTLHNAFLESWQRLS